MFGRVVDQLTGRRVIVRDPLGLDPALGRGFLATETSVLTLGGFVLSHIVQINGRSVSMAPQWVQPCPDNVVPMGRRGAAPC